MGLKRYFGASLLAQDFFYQQYVHITVCGVGSSIGLPSFRAAFARLSPDFRRFRRIFSEMDLEMINMHVSNIYLGPYVY